MLERMKLLPPEAYQAAAEAAFRMEASRLHALLPEAHIEHVGSSAVPGLLSKGDLDLCVLVPQDAHASAVQSLVQAGYAIKPDTLRTPELCMLLPPEPCAAPGLDLAVQLVARGSRFEFFLHFRDALRADPALVARYNELKRAHEHADPARYREAKAHFVAEVLGLPRS